MNSGFLRDQNPSSSIPTTAAGVGIMRVAESFG